MAATFFSDLRTEAGLKAFDGHLSGKSYISGEEMTKADLEWYLLFENKPSSESYPNASKWYEAVKDELVTSFIDKASGVNIFRQAASKGSTAEDTVGRETEEEKESIENKENLRWRMPIVAFVPSDDASAIQEKVHNIGKVLPQVAEAGSRVPKEKDGIKKLLILLTMVGVDDNDDVKDEVKKTLGLSDKHLEWVDM